MGLLCPLFVSPDETAFMKHLKNAYCISESGESMVDNQQPASQAIKAGKIAARVLKEVSSEIKAGAKVYTICTLAEKKIIDYGGRPAFPACVSMNHAVAHYTSPPSDKLIIPDFGLVKLDIGVHIDGYAVDTALTIDIDGSLEGFVVATDDALQEAIDLMVPGASLSDVGARIEKVIKEYGLRSIKEVCGHNLKRYQLYGGKRVPNGKERGAGNIEVGEYYAVEPYATSGRGVIDSKNIYVFANTGSEQEVEGVAEKLRQHLLEKYGPFPFALRWIGSKEKSVDVEESIRELLKYRIVKGHPVILEKSGRPVSQSEHTVFISENGPVLLTGRD